MSYTPLAAANTFITEFGGKVGIEHMKLQKVLFYTYGWWLAKHDDPLLSAKPEVWRYGPVFSSLYWRFSRYKDRAINTPDSTDPFASNDAPTIPKTDHKATALIRDIWEKYGSFDSFTLSDMTHRPGTPWQVMAAKYNFRVPQNLEIHDEVTKSYFRGLERAGRIV